MFFKQYKDAATMTTLNHKDLDADPVKYFAANNSFVSGTPVVNTNTGASVETTPASEDVQKRMKILVPTSCSVLMQTAILNGYSTDGEIKTLAEGGEMMFWYKEEQKEEQMVPFLPGDDTHGQYLWERIVVEALKKYQKDGWLARQLDGPIYIWVCQKRV